jgi:EAL domain-containing protein (putative c-di-GMP-specific phosphodiesterase class I)/GGDEF domain-containing protein
MAGPYLVIDNAGQERSGKGYLAVCVATLEGIGRLTSLFGSEAAGAAAQEYAARLDRLLRQGDQLIPINEAKHCLLIRGLRDRNHALLAGQKLERLFDEPFSYRGHTDIPLKVRAGIACASSNDTEAEDLFRVAEAAREAAVSVDRAYQLADEVDVSELHQRWKLNEQLEDAISAQQLKLYYQPKVTAGDHRLAGAEGLVRWEHETGLLAPGQFLPHLDAERMTALTRYVIRQCVRDLAADPWMPPSSINLESFMLSDSALLRLLLDELSLWDVDPSRLIVEVTENGLVSSLDSLCPEFNEMRQRGVRIAMDDFGTGHSSLAQFKGLPLDELKIERSFITHLASDGADRYLTRMMIELGHFFGLSVVAEGVETAQAARILNELNCDLLQGFYFAPPLSPEDFRQWVSRRSDPVDSA